MEAGRVLPQVKVDCLCGLAERQLLSVHSEAGSVRAQGHVLRKDESESGCRQKNLKLCESGKEQFRTVFIRQLRVLWGRAMYTT